MIGVPVGLVAGDLLTAGSGHEDDDPIVLVEDAQQGVLYFDGDGGTRVREADLHALADDLDATATGDPPLDMGDRPWRSGDFTVETRAQATRFADSALRFGSSRIRTRRPRMAA